MKFQLVGLNCADCARKIEQEIQGLGGVNQARLNFATLTLDIQPKDKSLLEELKKQAITIVQSHEPEVKVLSQQDRQNLPYKEKATFKREGRLILAIAAFALSWLQFFPIPVKLALVVLSYTLSGYDVLYRALRHLLKGKWTDEFFLMSVATLGAFFLREYQEAAGVMVFYQLGEYFQTLAVGRSRRSIEALINMKSPTSRIVQEEKETLIPSDEVSPGDYLRVRPGERIPVDGKIVKGSSWVDNSPLTGESVPVDLNVGDSVYGGTLLGNSPIEILAVKSLKDSAVSQIFNLVEEASLKKSPTEKFITRFSRVYTPTVVIGALLLAILPPLVLAESFTPWIYRALVFLVISCPCALVLSIPLSYFGGIGAASRKGILIKGSNYLEKLTKIKTAAFDKTGTLTMGRFSINKIYPETGYSEKELLQLAAIAESHSNHPIAHSIKEALNFEGSADEILKAREHRGKGMEVFSPRGRILAGNKVLLGEAGIKIPTEVDRFGTQIFLALDDRYIGCIAFTDQLRPESIAGLEQLKKIGVKKRIILTGDSLEATKPVAEKLGIDSFYAELLPKDKMQLVEKEIEQAPTLFVGDGINDAPVLRLSDVGIAMGELGSQAAVEAADIVLMQDNPVLIPQAIQLAQKTQKIVWQNILLALGIKLGVLALGALGLSTLWEAVFADVGVALLAVLNASRLSRK